MTGNKRTSRPRVLVLRAPGINCERESYDVFERAGAAPEYVHVKRLLQDPDMLFGYQILMVPGGFAYGDDIAAGRVLAQELRLRVGERLLQFIENGGLALGICNGFQVLVRLGLLPRTGGEMREEVSLTHNMSNHYECRWVRLITPENRCVFLDAGLDLRWPAAHAEGRLWPRDQAFGRMLVDEGYAALLYADAEGEVAEGYPENPNGSPLGLAGLTDVSGRVLGVMPHPDRAYLGHHMPDWRRDGLGEWGDGMGLFREMVRVAQAEG